MDRPKIPTATHELAARVETYIEVHLFDAMGLLLSGIDAHTGRPFEREFITPIKVPRRAASNPWAYWTYEDSIMATGLYIDALVNKHESTGDTAPLTRCQALWEVVRRVFSSSQIHGIGAFLRPYGGFQTMREFLEPLGTDQAGPLFHGLWRYLKHADDLTRRRITDCLFKTLGWYEQQGFEYFYYKFLIHSWQPGEGPCIHNASYYIPAIAWAARATGDPKWNGYLDEHLPRYASLEQSIYDAFIWSSDLPIVRAELGERWGGTFTDEVLQTGYQRAVDSLKTYIEPGMTKYMCAGAKEPGFQSGLDPSFNREIGMGFAYFATRHIGRSTPRHELHHLAGLASVGVAGAWEKAVEVLALKQRVPEDFTAFVSDDYDRLPETVHLYARSVGVNMVGWLRDYWLLRNIAEPRAARH